MSFTGRRVLVVEDEYFIAQDVAEALRSAGADVLGPFAGEDEAMQAVGGGAPDLAVLDINLRGRVSFRLAEWLRQLGVPFAFATGYEASSVPEGFRDVPLWKKPFEAEALLAALTTLGEDAP